MMRRTLPIWAWACWLSATVAAADPDTFRQQVAPLLERHCVGCHSGAEPKGGLDLSTAAGLAAGGQSGPAVVAGKPHESSLVEHVSGEAPAMPKDAPPLSTADVAALHGWIAAGAGWPDGLVLADKKTMDADWWSLKPLAEVPVPPGNDPWVRTPVDAFVLERLGQAGLEPSPEADRRTLARRLSYDLHGLPPAPEDVEAFVSSDDPLAYEALVDRLLASPRYGERWGRHWLDVVHFGESHGYDKDKPRPNAWPYRDYVIAALNVDKPYNRFVAEQIAGDVLWPLEAPAVVATGFIAAGPWDFVGHTELREGTTDKEIARSNDRDDMLATAMSTFVSLTVHCARCHDHKFDPITQRDYYALQAVFAGVERADRPYDVDPDVARQRRALASHESPEAKQALAALPEPHWVYAGTSAFAAQGTFVPPDGPRPIRLLARGDVRSPSDAVDPGAVACLAVPFVLDNAADEGARRAALARWLIDPANGLLRRSIVNRVWQYHFGAGIVDTPNDFGRLGAPPSHAGLLEWLAGWFAGQGHSLKRLHRLLVTSATYRQSSQSRADGEQADAQNRYLWRMNRARLDAECVRDALLCVSGRLDLAMGGPSAQQFQFKDDHSPIYDYGQFDVDDRRAARRGVYRFLVRSVPDPLMDCLDCADPSILTPKRTATLTALQALALLNNPLVVRESEHFAARLARERAGLPGQIERAYRLAFGRPPTAAEQASLGQFAEAHGLANACRLIFNSNEFVFVD